LVIAVLHDVKVRRCYLLVFALAFTTHVLNVFVFFLIGRNLEVVVSLEQWLFIVPSVLLFSMLPISAGGWGLREVSLIVALGGLGVRPEEAIIPRSCLG